MEPQLDLTQNPGLGVCDRCERITELRWFGCFHLCEECALRAAQAIGLEAAGRAIERLNELSKQQGKRSGRQQGTRDAA